MKLKFITLTTYLLLGCSIQSAAGELDVNSSISTSLISSQNNTIEFAESDASIISVKPSIRTSYKSKRLVGSFTADHNQIQSETTINGNQSDSFTNYQYSGDISLIDQILSLKLTGGQSYRSILSSQYFVNDSYLGADDLSKTRNNSASVFLTIPSGKYLGFELNGGVSSTKSDRSSDTNLALNNENQFLKTRFYQGDDFTRLSWNFNSSYQNTDRSANDNLTSRVIDGEIGFGLFSNIRAVIQGRTEKNELANANELSIGDLNYDSLGIGLSWFASKNRKLTLTYNQSERNEQEQEKFIGLDLNWHFTSRTSIQANYGKRFFGDSGTFSLIHNTRHLRTRISYDEQLTTSSRLLTSLEDQGVFVCPSGDFSFNDCFQPSSPSYVLQPGQQFTNLLSQIPELSEQVILRKGLNASFGLSGKRITSALSISHNNIEYLETDRVQKNNLVTLNNSLQVGRKTKLNLTISLAQIDEVFTGTETETISTSFGISRKLGRNMSTNLDYRYLDRSSTYVNSNAINLSNSDLIDRRLTLEFVYDF